MLLTRLQALFVVAAASEDSSIYSTAPNLKRSAASESETKSHKGTAGQQENCVRCEMNGRFSRNNSSSSNNNGRDDEDVRSNSKALGQRVSVSRSGDNQHENRMITHGGRRANPRFRSESCADELLAAGRVPDKAFFGEDEGDESKVGTGEKRAIARDGGIVPRSHSFDWSTGLSRERPASHVEDESLRKVRKIYEKAPWSSEVVRRASELEQESDCTQFLSL